MCGHRQRRHCLRPLYPSPQDLDPHWGVRQIGQLGYIFWVAAQSPATIRLLCHSQVEKELEPDSRIRVTVGPCAQQ